MDPKEYQSTRAGKPAYTPLGYWTFIPNPLPPEINWTTSLITILTEAERALANLASLAKSFPIPEIITQPFIHTEAVISSRIEGTQSDMLDLYSYEVSQLSFFEKSDDVREVYNYVKAIEFGLSRRKTLPISLRMIREIHGQLMKNVRGEHLTPGEFRRSQNWIGPPGSTLNSAPYVPPHVEAMMEALGHLENYLHAKDDMPLLIKTGLVHYQFEAIHPFLDGNGRIGRLLLILLMCEWNLLPMPVLNLSAYFDQYRQRYYDTLLSVSQQGNWEKWLSFFLEGVKQQSSDSAGRIENIYQIHTNYKVLTKSVRNQSRMHKIIDYLFIHPVFSITQMASNLEIPFKSVVKYIDVLIASGIVREITGRSRNRIFHATEILALLLEN